LGFVRYGVRIWRWIHRPQGTRQQVVVHERQNLVEEGLRVDDQALASEDGVVLARIALVSDQDVLQAVTGRIDGLAVDHQSRKLVTEYLRLQTGAGAGARDVVERRLELPIALGTGMKGQHGGGRRGQRDEDGDRRDELVQAQARAAEGHHLRVGGESPESDQDGEQHGHRYGHLEKRRHDVGDEPQNMEQRDAAAHYQLDQSEQPRDQQDGGEHRQPEHEGGEYLAEDVMVNDLPHGGETDAGEESSRCLLDEQHEE